MGEMAINAAAQNNAVIIVEFFKAGLKSMKLCGADKGKIERIEEKNNILSFVIFKLHLSAFVLSNTLCFEIGGLFSNEYAHSFFLL
jgi:hypothetical protein